MTELALIALDGLDPRVVYNNPELVPNITELMDECVHGKWQTPGHTIPSYIATLTGEKYEVCNFHWDGGRGQYQRHRQTEFEFLWDTLDSSMTLVNMPVLYPPEDIDDAMVCGFLTPDGVVETNLARPQEAQDICNDMGYIHDVHADDTFEELGEDGMLKLLDKMARKRLNLSKKLIEKYNSDLFYGVWTGTDRWFHQCQKHDVPYEPLYEIADDVVGEMLKILPDDIPLVVFSDHGFGHFDADDPVHKGHMYEGWYTIRHEGLQSYRDDTANIMDLHPTVVNYLSGDPPENHNGRILFHTEEQSGQVRDRLDDLGYLD
jgi:predicted AlkP superfamily phosphohydrolase/phosphomutase